MLHSQCGFRHLSVEKLIVATQSVMAVLDGDTCLSDWNGWGGLHQPALPLYMYSPDLRHNLLPLLLKLGGEMVSNLARPDRHRVSNRPGVGVGPD